MERRVPDISRIANLIGYKNTCSLDGILIKVVEHERARQASKEE